jgi:hypothetical protein
VLSNVSRSAAASGGESLDRMTSEELKKLFAHCVEEARFAEWKKARPSEVQFVYACEYRTIWKFTPKEWWQFASKTVLNSVRHDLPMSRALRARPRYIVKGEASQFYSSDIRMRCVNVRSWTLQDWANELTRQ